MFVAVIAGRIIVDESGILDRYYIGNAALGVVQIQGPDKVVNSE
jgi:hypothetical protein